MWPEHACHACLWHGYFYWVLPAIGQSAYYHKHTTSIPGPGCSHLAALSYPPLVNHLKLLNLDFPFAAKSCSTIWVQRRPDYASASITNIKGFAPRWLAPVMVLVLCSMPNLSIAYCVGAMLHAGMKPVASRTSNASSPANAAASALAAGIQLDNGHKCCELEEKQLYSINRPACEGEAVPCGIYLLTKMESTAYMFLGTLQYFKEC